MGVHYYILTLFLSILMLSSPQSQAQARIKQVFQIARHGARTPSSFEFKPGQYLEKAGELTILGKVQNYYLGQEMRKRYIDDLRLIPEEFDPSQVVIKVSGKERVIASAVAFVNGLYPQEDGTRYENAYAGKFMLEKLLPLSKRLHNLKETDLLGIHMNEEWAKEVLKIIPAKGDLFFHADQENNCPVASQRILEIRKSQRILDLEEEYRKTIYPEIVRVINTGVGHDRLTVEGLNIQLAKRVLDNHRCNFFHNVEHPEFSDEALKQLEDVRYNFIYQILYKDPLVQAISATRILEDIYKYITDLKEKNEGPKFIFYAAHDHNIEGLLAILLDPEVLTDRKYFMVEFASILTIEVNKEEAEESCNFGTERYYLEFFYNDEPLSLRWCKGQRCYLNTFKEIVDQFVLTNLEEMCKKEISKESE